ncbi:tetratricopeptide repeat protein [Novosphingobium sp. 1949]|uniref:Tetratricopeptide repeat protein n=1 Tax=Novosphingobium organovorum TaxID=2930092 RepID=A0ABT0B8D1_9SPHN|nr:tetratricopeptide repeat protein [Novosphingobium organovorum]MCJ2181309.1 tetratricopeptide repeat protein [Novosphingobium organovorum]
MTWVLVIALALVALGLALFVFKVPAGGREAVAAALLLGLAGYVLQGRPSLPASPSKVSDTTSQEAAFLVAARQKITNSTIPPTNRYVVIGDAFARNGQTGDAARVLLGAVEDEPKNSDAWLALANTLVAHSEGSLTPAATFAFQKAAKADPKSPGPPFFLGLAMAQSGDYAQARAIWVALLQSAPADAPWRPALAAELERLDAFLKALQKRQKDLATPEQSAPQGAAADASSTTND